MSSAPASTDSLIYSRAVHLAPHVHPSMQVAPQRNFPPEGSMNLGRGTQLRPKLLAASMHRVADSPKRSVGRGLMLSSEIVPVTYPARSIPCRDFIHSG